MGWPNPLRPVFIYVSVLIVVQNLWLVGGEHLHRKGVIDGYTHFELKTLGAGLATIALALRGWADRGIHANCFTPLEWDLWLFEFAGGILGAQSS